MVASTVRQSRQVDDLLEPAQRRRERQRTAAAGGIIRKLLSESATGLDGHEFRLFLPNADRSVLDPAFESAGLVESGGWRSGIGVTGKAWERNSYVIATGAAVSDGTYGLTSEQQRRYSALAVVAATPVQNVRGQPLAVLSVSSEVPNGPLEGPDGQALHLELAEVVARVLIDIGRLADD